MAYEEGQRRLQALWEAVWEEEQEQEQGEIDQPVTSYASDNGSCDEEAPSEHSVHNTDTEQSSSDDDGRFESLQRGAANYPLYTGKDGTKWLVHKIRKQPGKTSRQNIVTQLPGVKGIAKNAKTILDCWKLFFPDEIIEYVTNCTNKQLDRMRLSYGRESKHCLPTDFEEMNAFLGLLYLAGVKRAQHLNTSELWSTDGTAPEYFAATLSQRRFHTLVQAIRFDDKDTRAERAKEDNLAPVRDILHQFIEKCVQHYTVGSYVTIDEMLEGFRGRCKFRQYIANKPAKYGIKIYAAVDARMFYTHNIEIYAGKQPNGPYQMNNDAQSVVTRLLRHCSGTGRNVTTDNYFTSVPLANDLRHNHRLTLVGTLRKNKREIPPIFLDTKRRHTYSSMFAWGVDPNKCLLTSYVPKKNKNVLMLSTFHEDDDIDPESREQMKPSVITFYNLTKGAVDVVDRMKAEYSVTRVSNRWPLTIFCTLLNIAGINSQIIYFSNTNNKVLRRLYLTDLAKQLSKPHIIRRSKVTSLSIPLRQKMKNILGHEASAPTTAEQQREVKPRCSFCPKRKNRFTKYCCDTCTKPICKEHTAKAVLMCTDYFNRDEDS